MATHYTLHVKHSGTESGDFCLFQTTDRQSENTRSLVWFKKHAHPGTDLSFIWSIDYGFVWSEQGVLIPGAVFQAAQIIEADPFDITKNSIGFTRASSTFQFIDTNETAARGYLGMSCDESIPAKTASVGISMSGKATFARMASPNMAYTFRPHPRYWIVFGEFEDGEVIDLERMTRKYEILFSTNLYEKNIRLSEKNTWLDESK